MRRPVLVILGGVALASVALVAQTARPTTSHQATELYAANCVMCHMPDGNAAIEQMNFSDGKWIHGTTPAALAKVIRDGVPGTAMMSFKDRFSDKEILALANYVRTFDKTLKPASGAKKAPAGKTPAKAAPKPAPPKGK